MAKFTPAYLKKLEDLLKESLYEVRYEKGNFKSNYCILEAKKVVVINKFSTLESRIQALLEIIQGLNAGGEITVDLRQIGLKNPIVSKNGEAGFDENNEHTEPESSTEAVENTAGNDENKPD